MFVLILSVSHGECRRRGGMLMLWSFSSDRHARIMRKHSRAQTNSISYTFEPWMQFFFAFCMISYARAWINLCQISVCSVWAFTFGSSTNCSLFSRFFLCLLYTVFIFLPTKLHASLAENKRIVGSRIISDSTHIAKQRELRNTRTKQFFVVFALFRSTIRSSRHQLTTIQCSSVMWFLMTIPPRWRQREKLIGREISFDSMPMSRFMIAEIKRWNIIKTSFKNA